jgi:ParB family transcriptional regulator, chromosome partitioning protein
MSERRALGKGISALIPEKELTVQENIPQLKLGQIRPNPFQPREVFDDQGLEELTQSIKEKGIIQPVLVRRRGDHYELIAGERRFRAAQMLKLEEIPAIIKDVEDEDSLELSLIENIQRQDLNPIEEARAYKYLIDKFNLTQERVSEVLGKARVSITNTLRLLNLPQEVQEEMRKGRISFAHGRALLELTDPNQQRRLAQQIIANTLSVNELENLIKKHRPKRTAPKVKHATVEPYVAVLEEGLQQILATKVRIIKRKKRGHIIVEFYSEEDLERIVKRMRGGKD